MKRLRLPEPNFYPIQDLAILWGCSPALLQVFAECGTGDGQDKLKTDSYTLAGKPVVGVSLEEKKRFERLADIKSGGTKALNAGERKSLLGLVGAFSVLWSGGDERHLGHPYTLLANVENAAATLGVPMIRGDDTNTRLIQEAVDLIRRNGYKGPRM
jgi:hypothetical protein